MEFTKTFSTNKDKEFNSTFQQVVRGQIDDLKFMKIEIAFLILLLKSYPFQEKIPNLFEKITLFNTDLNDFETNRKKRLTQHKKLHNQLTEINEDNSVDSKTLHKSKLNKHTMEFQKFTKEYQSFKTHLFEYLSGII